MKIIVGIIAVIGAVIRYIILPLMEQKISKEDRGNLYFWVKTAVHAVEQIYNEKGQGQIKKENVVRFLKEKGYDVTEQEIDFLIEAVVLEMKKIKDSKVGMVE